MPCKSLGLSSLRGRLERSPCRRSTIGAGASAELAAATATATPEDLQAAFEDLGPQEREKLLAALGKCAFSDGPPPITAEILAKQNSETSNAILEAFEDDATFQKLADRLAKEIQQRDAEDSEKLAKGISLSVEKGVLPKEVKVEDITKVMVSGKSPDEITEEIISKLGDAPSKGCVLILQGLSGTGKGTTVAKLKEKLPQARTWSNGNIFRSITLLAVTHCEKENCKLEDALTPEKLAEFCKMLEFDKFGKDFFDVKIEGLGLKYFASEVEKTVLKDSKVGKNVPSVAEVTQGECISFVSGALEKMAADGINVLVEGREQTLSRIRSPHRFELALAEPSLIGERQAALQAGGIAWERLGKSPSASADDVGKAIAAAIAQLAG